MEYKGDFTIDYIAKSKSLNLVPYPIKFVKDKDDSDDEAETEKQEKQRPQTQSKPATARQKQVKIEGPAIIIDQLMGKNMVHCRGIDISVEQADAITSCLAMHTKFNLSKLSFWRCRLNLESLKLIVDLAHKGPLEHLQIDDNDADLFSGTGNQAQGVSLCLAELVAEKSRLTLLSLRSNSINDATVKPLIDSLKTNQNLVTLNLWNNSIGDDAVSTLANSLCLNRSLNAVSLGKNSIGDQGVKALCHALTKHEMSIAEKELFILSKEAAKREEEAAAGPSPKKGNDKQVKIDSKKTDAKATKKNEPAKKVATPNPKAGAATAIAKSKTHPDGLDFQDVVEVNGMQLARGNRYISYINLSDNNITEMAAQLLLQMIAEHSDIGAVDGIKTLILEGNDEITADTKEKIDQAMARRNQ